MLWLDLLIGTTVAWVAGLLPALIARYAWVRGPLQRANANWIAGTWCVLCWFIFRLLNAAASEGVEDAPKGTGFVWILIFLVSRWIMTRGSSEPPTKAAPEQLMEPSPARKLTRAEMIEGLTQITIDPNSSPQMVEQAEKRLMKLNAGNPSMKD